MKKIEISDEVWGAIAERGKFGETEDDVLRRVFDLSTASQVVQAQRSRPSSPRRRRAVVRMHAAVEGGQLVVQFESGDEDRWPLPDRSDKASIKRIRDEAVEFALAHEASDPGQTNAVRKALTDTGYHLTK